MRCKKIWVIGLNLCMLLMLSSFAFATNATQSNSEPSPFHQGAALTPAPEFQKDPASNFRAVRWGMSVEEVKALEGKKITNYDKNKKTDVYRIGYKDEVIFGDKYWLVYSFLNDKCWGGSYAIDYAEEGAYERLLDKLTQSYGPGKLTKDIELEKVYTWNNGDTFISLTYKPETRQGRRINLIFVSEALSPFSYHEENNPK